MSDDPHDLNRFLTAQTPVYDRALSELRAGSKQSHWMWFIFPQLAGLGHSAMAQRYAIASLAEARAFLRHPTLGARLLACTAAMNAHQGLSARQILGPPDDLKFRSSMTLFRQADPAEPAFVGALDRYFDGQPDPATLALLDSRSR